MAHLLLCFPSSRQRPVLAAVILLISSLSRLAPHNSRLPYVTSPISFPNITRICAMSPVQPV